MINSSVKTTLVAGMHTIIATKNELAEIMVNDCLIARNSIVKPLPKVVFSSNGQGIALYGQSSKFREAMDQADIIHADGMSVVKGSRLWTKKALPERIPTTDFFHNAALAAEREGLKFYILGGSETQNQAVCKVINTLYPKLEIVGRRNGYFKEEDNDGICADIVASKADVLWVGLGKPLQEYWSVENRDKLKGVGWIKTCGGLYAFLTGDSRRAPEWMQNMGLEWLYRVMQDPGRLAIRYLTTNPYSFYRIWKYSK